MQNLRTLRQRIRSVQNTQKITRAMQMVAGAKLRRAQGELGGFRPYVDRLKAMTQRFLAAHPELAHPLLMQTEDAPFVVSPSNHEPIPSGIRPSAGSGRTVDVTRCDASVLESVPAGLIVVTSDTGLCGTYNERVLGLAGNFLLEHPSATVVSIGKKGTRVLVRRGISRLKEIVDWGGRYDSSRGATLLQWLKELYLSGAVSAWWVAYTRFISAMRFQPAVERFLPLTPPSPQRGEGKGEGFPERVIIEPNLPQVTEELLNRFVEGQWTRILLEAFTSEHSARMIAMKNATDNAAEMIDSLTLVRNKVRQAAITKELIEVVSGAEVLR